ncbi:MAG: alpha/beta hydrolase [Pegethrix bostrychoides GSE-TBD4-15B]|jgi:pimeloyl-ACP methyl ester carboxylesterase|uniref:Alpha/beta hydrolase n=1 Tax=Pegethrix bostrychoides GSE-TBD4-15B TaxID=2839662 RepID=A0A951U3H2_9CYAN|nr:alpha/beta hydrolase [Pegethrix bostrychoides GSE-TBD4-15B]
MLQFQPPGFGQRVLKTSLGVMVYYEPVILPSGRGSSLPLVFLHSLGGGSSAYEWSKVYPAFAADYRVIAPDLIGWGQSTHPERHYRPDDYFTMLSELLDWLGEPAVVVAASLTAGLTIRLAIQRPELFRQLFLVAPSGYSDFGLDYGQNLAARLAGLPGLDQIIYQLGAANELAVRNFLEQFLFADRRRLMPETVAAYLASAQQFNASYAALASLRGDLCFDLALYLGNLRLPTTFVWGEQARFSSVTTGARLAALNPDFIAPVQVIPEVGVLPHLELPARVIGLLSGVLNADLGAMSNN